MQLSIDTNGADKVELELREFPGKISRAIVRALNRGIASGRTVMVREIARDTGLKSTDVREALRMREASIGNPVASLAARLNRLPLIAFNARQTREGVTY